MTLPQYVALSQWGTLDALVVTQSFLQQHDAANMLDLQSEHNMFRKLLIANDPAFNAGTVAEFIEQLQRRHVLAPIAHAVDEVLISDNVMGVEAPLLANLQTLWKKEDFNATRND